MRRPTLPRSLTPVALLLTLLVGAGCWSAARIPVPSPQLPPSDGLLGSPALQEVVDLQVRRDGGALVERLSSPDAAVRARAALALASVQDPLAEGALQLLLDDPVVTVRGNAAFALAQIPAMDGGAALSLALASEDDPGVRDRLVSAIGRRGAPEAVVSLVGGEPDAPHRALWTLALAEGGIRGIRDEALVAALTDRILDPDPEVRFAAGYYFGRVSTAGPWIDRAPLVRDALDGYRPDEPTAMYLVLGLARVGDPALDRDRLLHWLANGEDWRIRVGAADAVGNPRWLEDPVVVNALFQALADPVEHVRATAASAIGILIFSSPDARARAAAMMDGPAEEWRTQASFAQGLVAAGLTDMVRSWTERMAGVHPVAARMGIEALAAADGSDVTSRLFDLAGHPEPEVRAAALRILGQRWQREGGTSDTLQPYFELFRERLADEANLPAARAAGVLANPAFERFGSAALVQNTFLRQRPGGDPNRLIPLVEAMGMPSVPFLRELLDDSDYRVRRGAALALERLTGEPVVAALVAAPDPEREIDWDALARLGGAPRLEVETDRGTMVIRLLAEQAPLTVQSFVEEVEAGLHDGVSLHRVVPNFVVQGGDFGMGDGTGGPGYALRTEITSLSFRRGVLGMASNGKDTEGSQFFVTHSDQPHLDGSYTAFGWLESGEEVLDRIQEGDWVVRMRVLPTGS